MEEQDPINLSPELEQIAFEELGETRERRNDAIKELQSRIAALPEEDRIVDTSDRNLIRFIRARKFDLDRALQTTVEYHRFHVSNPDWVRIDDAERELLTFKCFAQVIEQRGARGKLIFIMLPTKGVKKFTPEFVAENPLAMIRFNIWMFDKISRNLTAQFFGVTVICPYKGFTIWDNLAMSRMAPVSHHIANFRYVTQCVGLRLSGVYVFEEPAYFRFLWTFMRVFLSAKLTQRIHFCGSDYSVLPTIVDDMATLPIELGGAKDMDGDDTWLDNVLRSPRHR